MESKFLEAIKRLVTYDNKEFLRSFQLRSEIKECNNDNSNGRNKDITNDNNNNIITTDAAAASAYLLPPFETIGFLEAKWFEVLKELVEYGNKNILGNFALYLVMEERRVEEYAKQVTNGILDISNSREAKENGRKEEGGAEVHQHHHNNSSNNSNNSNNKNNHNNQSWSTRPRDKNGRFMSSNTVATITTTTDATAATAASAASITANTTTAVGVVSDNTTLTATPQTSTTLLQQQNHNHHYRGKINYETHTVDLFLVAMLLLLPRKY
jgi:hypothetical protein